MYTLRTVLKDKTTSNLNLGDNYSVHTKGISEDYEKVVDKAITNEKTYAIVVGNNGSVSVGLFNDREYFIMTESGKTFERL